MSILPCLAPRPSTPPPSAERRGCSRQQTLLRCHVWVSGNTGPGAWHCIVYDVSTTGLGITLPLPLASGHVLEIQPYGLPTARSIRARVVHVKLVEFVWFCGCELVDPLTPEEIQAWVNVSREWLAKAR